MTKIIIIIALLLGLVLATSQCGNNGVNSAQFENRHNALQKQLDSLKMQMIGIKDDISDLSNNQDTIKNSLFDLETNQDSIKRGIEVVYGEVSKDNESFIDKIEGLWK